MRSKLTIDAAVVSHIGCVRSNNEDNFLFDGDILMPAEADRGAMIRFKESKDSFVFAICDGMGGLAGGERASYIGVNELKSLLEGVPEDAIEKSIQDCVLRASDLILKDAYSQGKFQKEGTTLAMIYAQGNQAHVANVGDSRVYLLRLGRLIQISIDHTAIYRLMLQGVLTREQVRKHPSANVISCYMGMPRENMPEDYIHQRSIALYQGDRFLICSDGLSDLLPHERIEQLMNRRMSPMDIAQKLVKEALKLSGKDNVTVLVGEVSGKGLRAPVEGALNAPMKTDDTETTS